MKIRKRFKPKIKLYKKPYKSGFFSESELKKVVKKSRGFPVITELSEGYYAVSFHHKKKRRKK